MYLDFIRAKNDYLSASHRAYACELVAEAGGNLSVRIARDRMLVKPSGITLGQCGEENLLITDLDGQVVEGSHKPTKEINLHGGLYKAFDSLKAVVHLHPVYAMLCANCFEEMPLVTKQMKQIMDRPVPICKIKTNTVDEAGLEMIVSLLQRDRSICCLLLEEHGCVTLADTCVKAQGIAELVEENAKVFYGMQCLK